MTYQTEHGAEIFDESLEKRAQAYAAANYPGKPEKIVSGRPMLCDEDLQSVSFKLPVSQVDMLDRKAMARGCKRSELLREAVESYLAR